MVTRMGPLVHRIVRPGGVALLLGSLAFIVGMAVAQSRYSGYSLLTNHISDLGGPDSPWAWVYNGSVLALGILTVLAALLIRSAFPTRRTARLGLFLLAVAGIGAFLTGIFPEQSTWPFVGIHTLSAAIAFAASGLALLVLSVGMLRDTRWDGYRFYTFLSGVITLVALGLYSASLDFGLRAGGMERLIVAPVLLWGIVAGIHLLRLDVYAPPRERSLIA